ncbi:3-deoxy-D-manno-octulosonic acid transferase [Terrihabitans sp. B22-R8]|uniref:3-deoxy-D-manno-octulosonic acid transferase n=1 Tax=Terrihabitans sp. B22-R8 TaxID=3425128 RepID=UPI00403CF0E4
MAERAFLLSVYRGLLSIAGAPAARLLLARRRRQGKEMAERIGERRGRAGVGRPEGSLIWLHAASVGELMSILPLTQTLGDRGVHVLVTTGTVSSARLAETRLPEGAIHQFIPVDVPSYVRRFLRHWRPDIAILTESEIWPNMLMALKRAAIPVVIANARMSNHSFQRWRRSPRAIKVLLSGVDMCLAQSDGDAERLQALGAPNVRSIGNLKFDSPPPPASAQPLARLRAAAFGRRVFLAASVHPGEFVSLIDVHTALREDVRNLLTIVAPRHPDSAGLLAAQVQAAGLRPHLRSQKAEPAFNTDVFIVDTIGELGLFYRLAELAFVGGSLVEHGGQNPIEPAKLGVPILHGPHVRNFTDIYGMLDDCGGAVRIEDGEELPTQVAELMSDPSQRESMKRAAGEVMKQHSGALERTLTALDPYLVQLSLNRS